MPGENREGGTASDLGGLVGEAEGVEVVREFISAAARVPYPFAGDGAEFPSEAPPVRSSP